MSTSLAPKKQYQVTPGQWFTISPAYKGWENGQPFFLEVHEDLSTERVPILITDTPEPQALPPYYVDGPSDPRD